LIRIFFGAAPGDAAYDRLMNGYGKLGPYGLVWNIGARQLEAFTEIRDLLTAQFAGGREGWPEGAEQSILGRLHADGPVDATMLGNLIYMVEMGRYDTYSLFRWLTKFAAENPEMMDRIAQETTGAGAGEKS